MSTEIILIKEIRHKADFGPREPDSRAFELLTNGIRNHGLRTPIHVDKKYNLLEGWYRLLACKKLGHDKIEVEICPSSAYALKGGL